MKTRRRLLRQWLALALVGLCPVASFAQQAPAGDTPLTVFPHPDGQRVSVSGQINVISQWHGTFDSPYSGPNSLPAPEEHATSRLLTLSVKARVTRRTDVAVDIETAGGRGLGDALGLAGFTNLDVVRNPTLGSKPYLARLVVHQTLPGGLEISGGKLSTADYFDRNGAGSDSHLQFTNWTVDNSGAYDYAADTRGYTWGVVAQYRRPKWTLRAAEMLMPTVANGLDLDWNIGRAGGENVELEWRPTPFGDRDTTVRGLFFANRANMGDYREAVARFETGVGPRPIIEDTREQGRVKYGLGLNVEQRLTHDARAFLRTGFNDPHRESFAYTEVNDTLLTGADVEGDGWHRGHDKVGLAFVTNGISADHQKYLALGGLGFLLGDGNLHYGRERITEAYYTAHVWRGVFGSVDVQHVTNPGYNRDRGPVTVAGLRLHVDL